MKKVYKFLLDLLLIVIFSISSAICIYKEFINLSLLINSQEITGKIEEVKYTHTRRSHYCTVYFEYENEGIKYRNNAEFRWLLTDRIRNSIMNEYRSGNKIIIAFDNYGNFQVKDRIKKELILYLIYLVISIALLSFAVSTFISNFQKKKKICIYIQKNNYKIKEIEKLENIPSYINMLKQNKIICFGIGSNKNFVEYSFNGKEFIERKSKNSKESETTINDEINLEKIIKIKLNEIERKA